METQQVKVIVPETLNERQYSEVEKNKLKRFVNFLKEETFLREEANGGFIQFKALANLFHVADPELNTTFDETQKDIIKAIKRCQSDDFEDVKLFMCIFKELRAYNTDASELDVFNATLSFVEGVSRYKHKDKLIFAGIAVACFACLIKNILMR